jgi:hypothetical protein
MGTWADQGSSDVGGVAKEGLNPHEWQARFEKSASVTCVIDADSTIIYCNPRWNAFALENDGACATTKHVLGGSLFSYIPAVFEPHYRKLVDTSRLEHRVTGCDYECHSGEKFRKYHLKLLPVPRTDLLAMVHSLRVERDLVFESVEPSRYSHGSVVTMCAQCRRTKNHHHRLWDWVPDFVKAPPRRISHGICPDCTMYLYA